MSMGAKSSCNEQWQARL